MQLCRDLKNFSPRGKTAVAIGNFDGLHLGHATLLKEMLGYAKQHGLAATVLTFAPHPRRFFAPATPLFQLERMRDRLRRLEQMGVQQVVVARFNAALAGLSAEQFMDRVLKTQLQAAAVFVGENFAFGKGRGGNTALLSAWGKQQHIDVQAMKPVMAGGAVCSSSAVREALQAGDMQATRQLLGRDYTLGGRVVHGEKRGKSLGYATANIVPPPSLKLPRYGIYAVRVQVGDAWHDGVASLGVRPTVTENGAVWLEVHLLDFNGDLYGARLEVAFVDFLRDEKKFDSIDALTHQMAADTLLARQRLKEHP
jgi:riboflavin kinase/FMN adenylyltransferase